MTKTASHVEKRCIALNIRMTEQRRVIARVLSQSSDHPDVEEVHRRSVILDSRISISTVYRTMRIFEEAGIVERHDFGDNRARYEEAPKKHHDHLIDVRSGKVIEFQNDDIEELQKQVALEHGYRLISHKLELYAVPIKNDVDTDL